MRIVSWTVLAALLALGLAATPGHAVAAPPAIDNVVVTDTTLVIDGENLDLGAPPVVKLGVVQLAVQTSSAHQVTVQLPAGLDAGNYVLTLRRPNGGATARAEIPVGIARRIETTSFSGWSGASIAGNAPNYVFLGDPGNPTTGHVIITRPNQRLLGAATAALGLEPGSPNQTMDVGLCWHEVGSIFAPVNFVAGAYISMLAKQEQRSYSATATTVIPTPGVFQVGMCVRNNGGVSALTQNDYVNGWVMVLE